jgi:hypothetical protein
MVNAGGGHELAGDREIALVEDLLEVADRPPELIAAVTSGGDSP